MKLPYFTTKSYLPRNNTQEPQNILVFSQNFFFNARAVNMANVAKPGGPARTVFRDLNLQKRFKTTVFAYLGTNQILEPDLQHYPITGKAPLLQSSRTAILGRTNARLFQVRQKHCD